MVKNFSTEWVLWFHSIKDNQWNKSSYKRLYSIKSYLDYQLIIETFQQNHYQNGMFFIMKSDIFPNWEDPTNRMGGCLSFKIKSVNVINEWNKILLNCISETIMKSDNDKINGLSISPKKEFNIIKIWFSEDNIDYKEKYKEDKDSELILNNSMYKKHIID